MFLISKSKKLDLHFYYFLEERCVIFAPPFLYHFNKMGITSDNNTAEGTSITSSLTTIPAGALTPNVAQHDIRPTSSHISSAVPSFVNGVLYASSLSAHTARLLSELGFQFNYRRHRVLMARTGQPELMGDFWLPSINTFLCVYADMPLIEQGRIHTEVAKLGHNVVVLVGEVASPVRQCNSDPKNGWRGWRLEAFSGDMSTGWTTFLDLAEGGITLANMTNPYDARACTPRLLELYAQVASPSEASSSTTDTTPPLNKTLGKAQ